MKLLQLVAILLTLATAACSTRLNGTKQSMNWDAGRRSVLAELLESENEMARLYALIGLGREGEARALLDEQPHLINTPLDDQSDQFLIESVIRYGSLKLLDYFIAKNAKLDVTCSWGMTVLETAIATREKDRYQAVAALLKAGAGPNASPSSDSRGAGSKSALHWAVEVGNRKLVRLLLEHGANPNVADEDGDTPLHYLLSWRSKMDLATLEALLQYGADPNKVNADGETVLFSLSLDRKFRQWPEAIRNLVQSGADVNRKSPDGDTPLHHASRAWVVMSQIETLLELGADPTIENEDGTSPLDEAVWELNWLKERKSASPERIRERKQVLDLLQRYAATSASNGKSEH
jgi:ankyrin repeat protein